MDDLVDRLRAFAADCRGSKWQSRNKTISLCDEAADRVAELEAANRGLVRLNETTEARAEAAEARVAELEAERDEAMCEAVYLAKTLHRRFYQTQAPQWEPLNDVAGVISQIDNMAAGIAARAEAAEAKVKALVEALIRIQDLTQHNMPMTAQEEQCVYREARAALAVIQEDKT